MTTLPIQAGLGLRSPHLAEVLATRPNVAWWEVHSENYFGGGAAPAALEKIRRDYPVSLHGVGLGLGNAEPPEARHLTQLAELTERIQPAAISEHLAWNRYGDVWFNDLLPVPRYAGAIDHLCAHIDLVQSRLKRIILLENVSSYIAFSDEMLSEAELLAELVARTGCGLLLDVNNMHVNQLNHGIDARAELARLPLHRVAEIHVAGFEYCDGLVIDTHGAPVCDAVWKLLDDALKLTGPKPVLLERDTNLPPLSGLLDEYGKLKAQIAHHPHSMGAIA
ncbi:DUF692 domain-containing protein [Iodobacter sp. LRB]|uniref:MNIO family bufferin maturase n=1 Tax=unclassified Iodobacter TaxID=235634 RepID=UPI000C0EB205|nr:DUF692 domain-containing protein [Iodobacter sp. BJB302]PHV01074.1 hypothetical protein CSQ88_13965 [Iodobacter sp. BJB302]